MFVVPVSLSSIFSGFIAFVVLDLSAIGLALQAFRRGDWSWFAAFLVASVVLAWLAIGLIVFFCRITTLPKGG